MTAPLRARAVATAWPRLTVVGLVLVAFALVLFDCMLAASDRPTLGVVWGGLGFTCDAAGLTVVMTSV